MALISQSPTDPADQFTQRLAAYERRIADLERAGSRGPRYSSGAGAPAGTGTNGQLYYDNTNDRLYLSDGIGWAVLSEPAITTFVPAVTAQTGTITTVGAVAFTYTRSDGWLNWYTSIVITTNGTGATGILFTLPINALTSGQSIGHGMESALTGKTLWVINNSVSQAQVRYADNIYPGANGAQLLMSGRYRMTTRYS